MPNISFSLKDFKGLLGQPVTLDELADLLQMYAKAEIESYDKASDELTLKLDDTNLPYLWCPEGLARFLKGILGKRKGIAVLKAAKSSYGIVVDKSVADIRPHIAAFVAKGDALSDYLLRQLVQLQEKFCDGYGRRRQKVSIGLYSYKRITFPIHYKAVPPDSVKFTPLDFGSALNLRQILEQHPKGKQYGWILRNFVKYPILVDSRDEILSFPPIINSSHTGKLEVGDSNMLFEATGTDEESVNLAANIFAQNMSERGFQIFSVGIDKGNKPVSSPVIVQKQFKISLDEIQSITGLGQNQAQVVQLLQKAGYDARENIVTVPHYRADILHPVDIIEDIAIAFGFDKIPDEALSSYTAGSKDKAILAINALRKLASGMGFQEIFSHILEDRNVLIDSGFDEGSIVQLENFMSETYSAVRNSILPQLLCVLSKNKHADYPQKLFEEGLVVEKAGQLIKERHLLSLASAHSKADFTEMKQYAVATFASIGRKFLVSPSEHPAFIKGRAGKLMVDGKSVGVIGEVSPRLLDNLGIQMPVAAMEIDLSFLLG